MEQQGDSGGGSSELGDLSTRRPPLNVTTNQSYGRLANRPLEQGGPIHCRTPYAKLRQIGYWNDTFDKIDKSNVEK